MDVNPTDGRVTAPPGKLLFGVMTSVPLDEADSFLQRNLFIKIFKDLLLADGLKRLAIPVRQQRPDLLHKPLVNHIQNPLINP